MINANFLSVLCPFSCLYLQMSELAPRRLVVERPNNEILDDVIAASNPKCRLCLAHHPLRKCPKFRRLSPFKRLCVVKRLKYCINCLAHSHFVKECQSRERCSCRRSIQCCISIGELTAIKDGWRTLPQPRKVTVERANISTAVTKRAQPTTRLSRKHAHVQFIPPPVMTQSFPLLMRHRELP